MADNEVAVDDAATASRNETVKATVARGVASEVTEQAAHSTPADDARVASVAAKIRDTAIDDTAKGERAVGHARTAARGSQFIDYGFGVLYVLLATRMVLALIAAESSNGFVQLIAALTNPFYAPFVGIVSSPAGPSGHTLVVPLLIAIVAYALLHVGINGILRMVSSRKTEI
jgi:hypothetical protein